ncbi:hypothetical protein [Haladaptatus sp. NG-SE-30]
MSFSSRGESSWKYLILGRDILSKYATFGEETNFTTSIGIGAVSLGVTIAGFRSVLLSPKLSESGLSLISGISIMLFPLGIIYYTAKAAKRTTDAHFHTKQGLSKIIATYLLIGSLSVLLLHTVETLVLSNTAFFDLARVEILFGLSLTLLFTLVVALANYSTLSNKYSSLQEVLSTFNEESTENLDRIYNHIEGIGHVPRSETNRVLESLKDTANLDNTIIKGRGGVGKSGILKQVCKDCDHEILFIDASAYPTISSESELTDELNLDISLKRCIRQVAANRPLVVIFDQLDDTNRESGEVYSNALL